MGRLGTHQFTQSDMQLFTSFDEAAMHHAHRGGFDAGKVQRINDGAYIVHNESSSTMRDNRRPVYWCIVDASCGAATTRWQ